MYQAIYDSAWHHPGICWAAGALMLCALLWRRQPASFVWRALLLFQIAIMVDALFTGGLTPLASNSGLSTTLSVVFVVLGDLRFFALFERQSKGVPRKRQTNASWWLRALVWSLVVPIASLPARWLWPGNTRALFLTYEVMFALLALAFVLLRAPHVEDAVQRRWLSALCWFEVAQYVAWASADVLILSGVQEGLVFRLLPNTLYYAVFVPFAWLTAPSDSRASGADVLARATGTGATGTGATAP